MTPMLHMSHVRGKCDPLITSGAIYTFGRAKSKAGTNALLSTEAPAVLFGHQTDRSIDQSMDRCREAERNVVHQRARAGPQQAKTTKREITEEEKKSNKERDQERNDGGTEGGRRGSIFSSKLIPPATSERV